jgi:hypothetical protein
MANKKVNFDRALGFGQNESHRQQDIYFGLISDNEELKSLTGKQMAEVARLMAAQKLYGYNECGREFECWEGA